MTPYRLAGRYKCLGENSHFFGAVNAKMKAIGATKTLCRLARIHGNITKKATTGIFTAVKSFNIAELTHYIFL
jgi:hypothetical protein